MIGPNASEIDKAKERASEKIAKSQLSSVDMVIHLVASGMSERDAHNFVLGVQDQIRVQDFKKHLRRSSYWCLLFAIGCVLALWWLFENPQSTVLWTVGFWLHPYGSGGWDEYEASMSVAKIIGGFCYLYVMFRSRIAEA